MGGAVGAFLNAYLLAHHAWQTLFYVGGAVPVLLLPFLVFGLPESIRFLIARNRRPAAIAGIIRHLAPRLAIGPASRFTAPHEAKGAISTEALLHGRNAARTLFLWGGFLTIYGTLTALTLWGADLAGGARHGRTRIPRSRSASTVSGRWSGSASPACCSTGSAGSSWCCRCCSARSRWPPSARSGTGRSR